MPEDKNNLLESLRALVLERMKSKDVEVTINYSTFEGAVEKAKSEVEDRGFTVDKTEWNSKVLKAKQPAKNKNTVAYKVALLKDGKPSNKSLNMEVDYSNAYSLNMYIS